jgi:hypothetical protein
MILLFKNLALVSNFPTNPLVQNVMGNVEQIVCNTNDSVKFMQTYNACDFTNRLIICAPIQTELNQLSYNDPYFQLYDIQLFLSQANDFFTSGFNIGVAVFSLITNLTTFIVILNARRIHKAKGPVFKKDDELNSINEAFFTYMLANSVFNLAYSLTFLLSSCLHCVPTAIGEDYINETKCVITNMCVAGMISLMKLMSNYTYLLMSMNRYLLVGKDHATWIGTFAKANVGKTTVIGFVCSCLLSFVSVYQVYYFDGFRLSENSSNQLNSYYYYHSYLWGFLDNKQNFTADLENLDKAASRLWSVFFLTVVDDSFSYLFFCLFNLALDVMTVLKLKESLAEKARLSSTNKQDEQTQAERRSVIMVVLNSIVNILLRLPELLTIIFFFALAADPNQKYPFKILCYNFGQCLTLGEISNSFVVLSLSFNAFFYYFFNKTFKFAFHLLFCGQKRNKPKK